MTEEIIMKLGQDAIRTTAMVAGPILGTTLVVGFLVSLVQALTQINEQTLTFIPKLILVAMILLFAGPWMLDIMSTYTVELFESISTLVRE
jgi:flagellar biosynthetic protein FliQ